MLLLIFHVARAGCLFFVLTLRLTLFITTYAEILFAGVSRFGRHKKDVCTCFMINDVFFFSCEPKRFIRDQEKLANQVFGGLLVNRRNCSQFQ